MDLKKCLSVTPVRFFRTFLISGKLNNPLCFSIFTAYSVIFTAVLLSSLLLQHSSCILNLNFIQLKKNLLLSLSVPARYKVGKSLSRSLFIPNPYANCKLILEIGNTFKNRIWTVIPLVWMTKVKSRKKSEMPHFINWNAYNGFIVIHTTTFCLQDAPRI